MLDQLNSKFALKENVIFALGRESLPKAILSHSSGHSAEIYLFGAHLSAWNTPTHENLFFMSEKTDYSGKKALRGGIPLIFPQFGGGELPAHGFARTLNWEVLRSKVADSGEVSISFQLEDSEVTRAIWPHSFQAIFSVTLSHLLETTFEVKNCGNEAFSFQNALHTYFAVSDINSVEVEGLDKLNFLDSTKNRARDYENRGKITFKSEIDRVYLSTPDIISLRDLGNSRSFEIKKTHMKDAVVWNPWIEKTKTLKDLNSDDYLKFVCIESGNIGERVLLGSGETFGCSQQLSYN